jgi:hypothetical protein
MVIRVENTWGNDTRDIRCHLQSNVKEFGAVKKLGQRRFLQLHAACNPAIDEIRALTDILVANSRK